jgi:hypothetical protein
VEVVTAVAQIETFETKVWFLREETTLEEIFSFILFLGIQV